MPIFFFALLSGHLGALASPLWIRLYGVVYRSDMATVEPLLGQSVPWSVVLAAGWFYTLPALLVLYLYQSRWWFPGYLTGILTYFVFLLYHLFIEALGLRASVWQYTTPLLPFDFPNPLLSAIMGALVSLALFYVLLAIYRYSWPSMLIAILPTTLLLSLLIHGLLGAPLWIALLLRAEAWMLALGMVSTLALLGWAVHIITGGLREVEQGLMT